MQKIAEENIPQGADVEEDAEAKKAAFERSAMLEQQSNCVVSLGSTEVQNFKN